MSVNKKPAAANVNKITRGRLYSANDYNALYLALESGKHNQELRFYCIKSNNWKSGTIRYFKLVSRWGWEEVCPND